jgi:GAF domain-containing protein
MDPLEAFSQLSRIKLSDTDLHGVLARIAELAKATLADVDEVSVTLIGERGARTVAFTGPLALALDEQQYAEGQGPCLSAAASGEKHLIPDLAAEERWPLWRAGALAAGIRSSLAIGLPVAESVNGAVNVYSTRVDAFDEDTILLADAFVGYAVVAMANAHLYNSNVTLARHLQTALDSRAVIEQAKGIIMSERRCSSVEAFTILSKVSQDTNRKLRDVAAALVATAENAVAS